MNGQLADRPRQAAANLGIGLSRFYAEVRRKRIELLKSGRASLVTREAQKEYLDLLRREAAEREADAQRDAHDQASA